MRVWWTSRTRKDTLRSTWPSSPATGSCCATCWTTEPKWICWTTNAIPSSTGRPFAANWKRWTSSSIPERRLPSRTSTAPTRSTTRPKCADPTRKLWCRWAAEVDRAGSTRVCRPSRNSSAVACPSTWSIETAVSRYSGPPVPVSPTFSFFIFLFYLLAPFAYNGAWSRRTINGLSICSFWLMACGQMFGHAGSADAILALSNAGASVTAADKDGLTGKS